MTPSQLDHLRRIDSHLARLLDIAEKRTPGEWGHDLNGFIAPSEDGEWLDTVAVCHTNKTVTVQDKHNAAFIASCAGNAEAGWVATRAAIAHILSGGHGHDNGEDLLAASILAAFPLESLK